MRKSLFILALFLNALGWAEGPFFQHKDPVTEQEFENVYQNLRSIHISTINYLLNQNSLQSGATAYPSYLYVGSSGTVYGPLAVTGVITASNTAITTAAGNLDATKLVNNIPNGSLDSSSVTKQGNVFNGVSQLVQTSASSLVPNSVVDGSSVTKQGNTFNGNSQLTKTTGTGLLQLSAGSKTAPNYSYSGATGYGAYQSGTTLALTTNGHNALVMDDSGNALGIYSTDVVVSSVDASGDIFGAATLTADGSATSPTYTFKSHGNYGMYVSGTQLNFTANGHKAILMDDGGAMDFFVTGVDRLELGDAQLIPITDNQLSLGNGTHRWSDFRVMTEIVYGKGRWIEPDGQTIAMTTNGHINVSGTAPTPSLCGATPAATMAAGSTDVSGTINVGGGVVTACTLTFYDPFLTNIPTCLVSDNSGTVTSGVTAISKTAMTITTSATLGGGKIFYICMGSDN